MDSKTRDGHICHSVLAQMSHRSCLRCEVAKTHLKLCNGLVTGLDRLLGCSSYPPILWWGAGTGRLLVRDIQAEGFRAFPLSRGKFQHYNMAAFLHIILNSLLTIIPIVGAS